jgi:hypothetical protein
LDQTENFCALIFMFAPARFGGSETRGRFFLCPAEVMTFFTNRSGASPPRGSRFPRAGVLSGSAISAASDGKSSAAEKEILQLETMIRHRGINSSFRMFSVIEIKIAVS